MRDFDEDLSSDYKGRDIDAALHEANFMVDTILSPPHASPLERRKEIALKTVRNFRDHINKGFFDYRKSVTEATSFAVTEWTGHGSILVDALDREFLDLLGGFGLYSYGIRHPKIIAAVKAQLDRSPQYSQEMLDPLRAQLAKVLALRAWQKKTASRLECPRKSESHWPAGCWMKRSECRGQQSI